MSPSADMAANFSFLVTTDNHMGFKHDDPLRRRDSFMAFAETLQIAREKDVDFILLGGDLFHMNRPNTWLEHKCIKILRQHMNAPATRGTTFRRVSGEFSHFQRVKHGNFEDPKLSVPYPIFTIHGNHDDPTGSSGKSVCEKLATCGLLNYFGKLRLAGGERDYIIEPIELVKGAIKIALYGIGFIPDKRLCAAFKSGNVIFRRPSADAFNVLVVHQNRVKYSEDKYIPDSVFPKWFHLIIRGHEHDAQKPTIIPESEVDGLVYQPGSTVATSIEVRESSGKQCGLMTVSLNDNTSGDCKNKYKLNYDIINLRCYRKILFKDVYQKEVFEYIRKSNDRRKLDPIEYRNIFRKFVINKIETLLEDYQCTISQETQQSHDSSVASEADVDVTSLSQNSLIKPAEGVYSKLSRFNLPLVRLRLEFVKKAEIFDVNEVNAMFYPNQSANRDIIKFKPQKIVETSDGKVNATFMQDNDNDLDDIDEEGLGDFGETINLEEERKETIESMILNYFNDKPMDARLKAISLKEYTDAVSSASQEKNIISAVLKQKRTAITMKFESILKKDHDAESNYDSELKILDWFITAFKEASGSTDSAGLQEDWDDDEVDDEEVMCVD